MYVYMCLEMGGHSGVTKLTAGKSRFDSVRGNLHRAHAGSVEHADFLPLGAADTATRA
jgi:hypothetical protein